MLGRGEGGGRGGKKKEGKGKEGKGRGGIAATSGKSACLLISL